MQEQRRVRVRVSLSLRIFMCVLVIRGRFFFHFSFFFIGSSGGAQVKILFAVSIKATRQQVAEKARRYLISGNYNRYDLVLLCEATYPRAKVLPRARLPRYTLGGFFFFFLRLRRLFFA